MDRFQARSKPAENREKRLKQILVWFMISRDTQTCIDVEHRTKFGIVQPKKLLINREFFPV